MRLYIFSDLHLDARDNAPMYHLIPSSIKEDAIAIISGDICSLNQPTLMHHTLLTISQSYRYVLFVPGNHEYHGIDFIETNAILSKLLNIIDANNLFILNRQHIVLDNVLFIGATLWSAFDGIETALKNRPITPIRKYKWTNEPQLTTAEKIMRLKILHEMDKNYIFETLNRHPSARAKVVITHHAPSFQSISSSYKRSQMHGLYASNIENEIIEHKPNLWVHGHTHEFKAYQIANTNIIVNPLGLINEETHFKQEFFIDI